jgi:2-dehydro-3-deoxyphosphogalactonate aldolase
MPLDEVLMQSPILAILRGVRPDEVLDHAEALFRAGVRAVEVPLNSPAPLDSLRRLAEQWGNRMAVGAGTVLESAQVDAVAQAGARFVVAPNTDPTVIGRAVARGLSPAPGFATASEAFKALACGARHLKLFPALTYGPAHLKQLMAVLPPQAVVWAVGGIHAGNMAEWWAAGARAFGIGGELYRPGQSPADTAAKAEAMMGAAAALPRA